MHKKTASLLAMVVALGGFALAVFIPTASAQKAHAATTCTTGTYGEYNQYCEPTTTSATTTTTPGTTTVVTSPVTTPVTTTTGTTTGVAAPAGLTVTDGVASIDVAVLTPNESFTTNGVLVTVGAITASGVEVTFGTTTVIIPAVATVSIASDGVVYVSYTITGGKISNRVANAKVTAAVTRQYAILPAGRTGTTASYTLPKGVSLGAKTTNAAIAKDITLYTMGKNAVRVPLKAAANKARTAFTVRFAKSEQAFVLYFNTAKLQYTQAETVTISKNKIKTLAPKFTLTTKVGSKSTKNVFSYKYPV